MSTNLDSVFRIERDVLSGFFVLYEWDDDGWEPDWLDSHEQLVEDGSGYLLKEIDISGGRIEVTRLELSQDPADEPNRYVVTQKYYTDLDGSPVTGDAGDGDEDHPGKDSDDNDSDNDPDDDDEILDGQDDVDDDLKAHGGRDLLRGHGGRDRLYGGAGDDDLNGGDDDDLIFGDDDDDRLCGGSGDDRCIGGRGDDLFVAGEDSGDDQFVGQLGIDQVSYEGALAAVSVNLQSSKARPFKTSRSGTGFDRLQSIENVTGSAFDDLLKGSSVANVLDGGPGDDVLDGFRGADRYIGGAQADRFCVRSAKDSGLGVKADLIVDFSSRDGDKLDLSAIDARRGFKRNDAFSFLESAPTAPGVGSMGMVWFQGGYLMASTDKDVAAEFAIQVQFKDGDKVKLIAADILL